MNIRTIESDFEHQEKQVYLTICLKSTNKNKSIDKIENMKYTLLLSGYGTTRLILESKCLQD